jgi:hypothetical protein
MIEARVGLRDSGKEISEDNAPLFDIDPRFLIRLLQKGKGVIYINDLESINRGLHPKEQIKLINEIKATISNNVQLIFTTNSPYLLDGLEFSEVAVFYKGHKAYLSEHPDAEGAKQTLTAGEFWAAEGESWVHKL